MCCNSAVVVCHIADGDVAPACCVNRGEGGQEGLRTWTNVDSDDDLHRHPQPSSLVTWHCHIAGVVGGGPVCSGSWWGGRMEVDGVGTHRGIVKYTTTMNDDCWSSFVVWLPCHPQQRGTWILY